MRTYTPHYNNESYRLPFHMPHILRTFVPIEKEELLSASCRYFPRHNKKETGGVTHAYTRLRLASGSVTRTRAGNPPQRRKLSLAFSYAAHPADIYSNGKKKSFCPQVVAIFPTIAKRRRGRCPHAYTRLRLASGSVTRTRAGNPPQRRKLSLAFSYAAHPAD